MLKICTWALVLMWASSWTWKKIYLQVKWQQQLKKKSLQCHLKFQRKSSNRQKFHFKFLISCFIFFNSSFSSIDAKIHKIIYYYLMLFDCWLQKMSRKQKTSTFIHDIYAIKILMIMWCLSINSVPCHGFSPWTTSKSQHRFQRGILGGKVWEWKNSHKALKIHLWYKFYEFDDARRVIVEYSLTKCYFSKRGILNERAT